MNISSVLLTFISIYCNHRMQHFCHSYPLSVSTLSQKHKLNRYGFELRQERTGAGEKMKKRKENEREEKDEQFNKVFNTTAKTGVRKKLRRKKRAIACIPLASLSSPYEVIIDHTGRPWHSNKSLKTLSNLQRDRLPYTPKIKPDGTHVKWMAYLGPGQSMLRRRPKPGQVPHFEEDDERWHVYYEQLEKFKKDYGHLNVASYNNSTNDAVDMVKLNSWCIRQRYQYSVYKANNNKQYDPVNNRYASISEYRIQKLQDIGFEFSLVKKWEERYLELKSFYKKYGHCRLKANEVDQDIEEGFYLWVNQQRIERRKFELIQNMDPKKVFQNGTDPNSIQNVTSLMTHKKIDLLDRLEFEWDPINSAWERNFERLKQYQELNGHCTIPYYYRSGQDDEEANVDDGTARSENDEEQSELMRLGFWVNRQRELYKTLQIDNNNSSHANDENIVPFSLTPERIAKLNSIQFEWNPIDAAWNQRYGEMIEYKKVNGHCNVPIKYEPNPALGIWTSQQRKYYNALKQKCSEDPQQSSEDDYSNYMTSERIEKLQKIGFVFRLYDMQWEDQFNELFDFQSKHGHCNVSRKINAKLANWIHEQRRQYRQRFSNQTSSMTNERIERLEKLGFDWKFQDEDLSLKPEIMIPPSWEQKYNLLKEYQKEHGHCNVSKKDVLGVKKWNGLYNWVQTQRKQCKQYLQKQKDSTSDVPNVIQEKKIERLESLGFVWDTKAALWQSRLDELKQYKEEHGDCRVPYKYAPNRQLGIWVSTQRNQYKKMQKGNDSSGMTLKKIEALDEIGFEWSLIR